MKLTKVLFLFNLMVLIACKPQPEVAIFIEDSIVFTNQKVSFHSASSHVETYEWDFGDGSKSTERNPTYTFSQPGCFKVSLKGADKKGIGVTDQLLIEVRHNAEDVVGNYEIVVSEYYLCVFDTVTYQMEVEYHDNHDSVVIRNFGNRIQEASAFIDRNSPYAINGTTELYIPSELGPIIGTDNNSWRWDESYCYLSRDAKQIDFNYRLVDGIDSTTCFYGRIFCQAQKK